MAEISMIEEPVAPREPKWTVPNARDLTSLNEWLGSVPVPQRDAIPGEIDREWVRFGFGGVVLREQLADDPNAKVKAEERTVDRMAFMLAGFLCASPCGIVWRCHPEIEWKIDPITGNGLSMGYARLARDSVKEE